MKGKYLITTDNYFYGPDGQHKHEIGSIILILSSFNLVQDIKRLKNN